MNQCHLCSADRVELKGIEIEYPIHAYRYTRTHSHSYNDNEILTISFGQQRAHIFCLFFIFVYSQQQTPLKYVYAKPTTQWKWWRSSVCVCIPLHRSFHYTHFFALLRVAYNWITFEFNPFVTVNMGKSIVKSNSKMGESVTNFNGKSHRNALLICLSGRNKKKQQQQQRISWQANTHTHTQTDRTDQLTSQSNRISYAMFNSERKEEKRERKKWI